MNLTETSKWFKVFMVFVIISIAIYYFIIYLLIPTTGNLLAGFVRQSNPPTVSFGVLPPLKFINKNTTGNPSYELNTSTGSLPTNFPDRLTVYRILQNPYSFDAGRVAQNNAFRFGYTDQDLITDLRGDIYTWRDIETGVQLEINLSNRNLNVNSNLFGRGEEYIIGYYSESRAIQAAEELLSDIQRIDNTYDLNNARAIAGRYQNQRLIEVEDFNRGNLYKVDFFRRLGNFRILGPDANKGNLSLYIGKDVKSPRNESTIDVPYADIYYNEILPTSNATYPIISVDLAWNEITAGKGIISSVTPRGYNPFAEYESVNISEIIINNIYLAYYENYNEQEYLQPIYVFSGNYRSTGSQGGDIVLYYPAIEGSYVRSIE